MDSSVIVAQTSMGSIPYVGPLLGPWDTEMIHCLSLRSSVGWKSQTDVPITINDRRPRGLYGDLGSRAGSGAESKRWERVDNQRDFAKAPSLS